MNTLNKLAIASLFALALPALAAEQPGCESGVCALNAAPVSEEGFQLLTTGEMKKVVDAKAATILDARAGKYDDGKRIPGAKSLNSESKKEEVEKALPSKAAPVVTYCSNLKCPASGMLAKHLKDLGYTNIREYPEGIKGWVEAGNPVEPAKK